MSRYEEAEDLGYVHYRCPVHGPFWSDSGPYCESCGDRQKEEETEEKTCDWCGDGDDKVPLIEHDGGLWHQHCIDEDKTAQAGGEES